MDEPRYKVQVADHEYWREQIKCQYTCPVHTDARGYVRAIAAGDYEHAYLIARGPNPLARMLKNLPPESHLFKPAAAPELAC